MSGCASCGGGSRKADRGSGVSVMNMDIREIYPVSDLVWIEVKGLGRSSNTLPSPLGKVEGGYGIGSDGTQFLAHKDDVQVWGKFYVPIEGKKVEPLGPAPSSSPLPEVEADDFTKIKGVGPAAAKALVQFDVTTFKELSGRSAVEVSNILGAKVTEEKAGQIIAEAAKLAASENGDS